MKLELKHLAGYLQHRLEVFRKNKSIQSERFFIVGASKTNVFLQDSGLAVVSMERIKPILLPLTCLKKDEFFDLYMDLCEEMESLSCEYLLEALINKTKYIFNINQLEVLEDWMNRNHFDWKYDLIGKGLAIDKTTLS
jgi:hypothetical protein